jgi:hypothetical protein
MGRAHWSADDVLDVPDTAYSAGKRSRSAPEVSTLEASMLIRSVLAEPEGPNDDYRMLLRYAARPSGKKIAHERTGLVSEALALLLTCSEP